MKVRLDQLLVERGLAESRVRAQALIRAGLVVVGEQRVDKPGTPVPAESPIRLKGQACPYVSRGGLKLDGALAAFDLKERLAGLQAADIGASTGGFTDCLLHHGVRHVWAVDTGRGQLHDRLRRDPRVTLREQANARFLELEWVGGAPVDLAVIDVSFISLRLILPPLAPLLRAGGSVVALVKPQFEAGPADVGRGGVVREPAVHRRVLTEVSTFTQATGWQIHGVCLSPLAGPAGNREFFLWLVRPAAPGGVAQDLPDSLSANHAPLPAEELQKAIERVLSEAYT